MLNRCIDSAETAVNPASHARFNRQHHPALLKGIPAKRLIQKNFLRKVEPKRDLARDLLTFKDERAQVSCAMPDEFNAK